MTKLTQTTETSNPRNWNSTKNQQIKERFVQREVLVCASYMMDELFKAGSYNPTGADLPQYEDITNYWTYSEYYGNFADFEGGTYEDLQTEISRLENLIENEQDEDKITDIQAEIDELNDLESEPAEIYEWWIVTGWLAGKLEQQGQCVLEYGNLHFWGRQTTGQAILLDGVISRICEGLQILEGQPNEWKF